MDVEHEIVVKRQVVVMECEPSNRTGSHSDWTPCASSTPIRRPLITLSNFSYVHNAKIQETLRGKSDNKAAAVNKIQDIPKEQVKKNGKKNRSRATIASSSEDEDDDKHSNENISQSKGLVIKLGSSQFTVGRMKKNRFQTTITSSNNNDMESNIDKIEVLTKVDERTPSQIEKKVGSDRGNMGKKAASQSDLAKKASPAKSSDSEGEVIQVNGNNIKTLKRKIPNVVAKNIKKCKSQDSSGKHQNRTDCEFVENVHLKKVKNVAKLSVSHEIFSDCKEIEHRDSLDLTTVDYEEPSSHTLTTSKSLKRLRKKSLLEVKKSNQKFEGDFEQNENEIGNKAEAVIRSKRSRKSPKEYWLPKSKTSESLNGPALLDNNAVQEKVPIVSSASEQIQNNDIVLNKSRSSTASNKIEYVKDIKEMSFVENNIEDKKEVFLVGQGWQFPTYKCCVLKIQKKCEASGRTTYDNSHFGGIVLKGKLLMTIDGNEFKMKGGQMFYVPPLRDWKAVNIGTTDCVLYYWCGRM